MKHMLYTDKEGYTRRVLVRDNDTPEQAQYGIPAGPPDVRTLDWNEIQKQINNQLADQGMFTWDDVNGDPVGVSVALTILKRALIGLYRQEDAISKGKASPQID